MRSIHAAHRYLRDFEAIFVVIIVEGIPLITNINVVIVRIPGSRSMGHIDSRFRDFSFEPRRCFPAMGERTAPAALIAFEKKCVRASSLVYKLASVQGRSFAAMRSSHAAAGHSSGRFVRGVMYDVLASIKFGGDVRVFLGRLDGRCRGRDEHRCTDTITSYPQPFSS